MSLNYDIRFLQAYDETGFQVVHTKLRYLLEVRQYYSCPCHNVVLHLKSMVVL